MSRYISSELRRFVAKRANYRCEYCLLPQTAKAIKHQIEHILPRQHNGQTVAENLALACAKCNRFKGTNVGGYDRDTGNLRPLFDPRTDIWNDHFRFAGAFIAPLTAEARVTIEILRLNGEARIEERLQLIAAGILDNDFA